MSGTFMVPSVVTTSVVVFRRTLQHRGQHVHKARAVDDAPNHDLRVALASDAFPHELAPAVNPAHIRIDNPAVQLGQVKVAMHYQDSTMRRARAVVAPRDTMHVRRRAIVELPRRTLVDVQQHGFLLAADYSP